MSCGYKWEVEQVQTNNKLNDFWVEPDDNRSSLKDIDFYPLHREDLDTLGWFLSKMHLDFVRENQNEGKHLIGRRWLSCIVLLFIYWSRKWLRIKTFSNSRSIWSGFKLSLVSCAAFLQNYHDSLQLSISCDLAVFLLLLRHLIPRSAFHSHKLVS